MYVKEHILRVFEDRVLRISGLKTAMKNVQPIEQVSTELTFFFAFSVHTCPHYFPVNTIYAVLYTEMVSMYSFKFKKKKKSCFQEVGHFFFGGGLILKVLFLESNFIYLVINFNVHIDYAFTYGG
jgi:hypothetical protein